MEKQKLLHNQNSNEPFSVILDKKYFKSQKCNNASLKYEGMSEIILTYETLCQYFNANIFLKVYEKIQGVKL